MAKKDNIEPPKPSLAELQDALQRAILNGADDPVLALIPPNSRTTREVLFGVYRNAYASRLVGILAEDHAFLKTYVGDDYFDTLARAYVAAYPSNTQNARWFGERLPQFLRSAEPYTFNPQLADLAELERALGFAFDAPDAEPATLADVQTIKPEDWEHLVLVPHPSAKLLSLTTNALAIWSALRDDEMPPDAERFEAPQTCLVWRHDVTPRVRAALPEEAMLWTEAGKSVPFGRLCELVAVFDDPETAPIRAAQTLQSWLAGGLLSGIRVEKPKQRRSRSKEPSPAT